MSGEKKLHPVQASALSDNPRNLYKRYDAEFRKAAETGKTLKEAVQLEWNSRYPDGIDGKRCVFSVLSGTLYFEWKPVASARRGKEKKQFDENRGENVFARPPKGSPVKVA